MYQNYYQQPQTIKSPQIGLKGRPVSSIEEVRAASIDFDGSVNFFPDLGNEKIYTKQINMDGTAMINMYQLTKIPTFTANTDDYITREEFEAAIAKLTQQKQAPPADFKF